MDPRYLAPFIDHSLLRPDTTTADVERACEEALHYGFRGLCVPSGSVGQVHRRFMGTGCKAISVVAFPHGTEAPDVKAHEASRAAAYGADEIDYVISIGAARENHFRYIKEEAVAILRQVRGKLVKGILEVGYLDEAQRFECARALADAGVHYVKTCTGFGPGQATVEDLHLIANAIQGRCLIKASGGIRERWQALEMLQAGAAVLGTSSGPRIVTP